MPSGGSPLLLSHRRHSGGNLGGFRIRRRAAVTARVSPRRRTSSLARDQAAAGCVRRRRVAAPLEAVGDFRYVVTEQSVHGGGAAG
jgi:hypothetical protein